MISSIKRTVRFGLNLSCPALLLLACAAPALADENNWPQFRGPGSLGVSDNPRLPDQWSTNQNVAWRAAIDGRGWSSPIVW